MIRLEPYLYLLGMSLDLRQLRYVIAVAEERNITRAAERLDMQPPPLSRQIKEIERELDVQLFRRKARGVELTDTGRVFVDNARSVLAQLDHTLEATRRTARGEQGRICVAYSSTVAFHPLVPRIIREFRPDLVVRSVARRHLRPWNAATNRLEHAILGRAVREEDSQVGAVHAFGVDAVAVGTPQLKECRASRGVAGRRRLRHRRTSSDEERD